MTSIKSQCSAMAMAMACSAELELGKRPLIAGPERSSSQGPGLYNTHLEIRGDTSWHVAEGVSEYSISWRDRIGLC